MHKMLAALVIALLTLPVARGAPRAKNVILFLADAGGLPTVNAASLYGYGKPQALYIQQMPHIGLSDTSTANNWVADSAAGMTAIVTGRKSNNGVLSQSAGAVRGARDGEPLKTILEYAEEHGLATGVVSDCPVYDATPAACYAHSNDRARPAEIFLQILKPRFGDGVDVVIGRGRERILKETGALGVDVWPALQNKGYRVLTSPDSWKDVDGAPSRLAAVFNSEEFSLSDWVDHALSVLSRNPKGLFLMVESDTHVKDVRRCLEAMLELDRIVRRTAQRMRGTDTLIIFTADHSYDLHLPRSGKPGEDIVPLLKVDGHHNAEEVIVAAQGPGSEKVRGFFPNTRLFYIMLSAYGWE